MSLRRLPRRCSACGGVGHNARTCLGGPPLEEGRPISPRLVKPLEGKAAEWHGHAPTEAGPLAWRPKPAEF